MPPLIPHSKGMFFNSYQLCSLLSVEQLIIFEEAVRYLLNMCIFYVCYFILTSRHTNQI